MLIWKRKYLPCLFLSILFIISGCYDSEDIDRRMIVIPIGIDSKPDGKMLVSFRMPLISPGSGNSSQVDQKGGNFIVRSSLTSGVFPALGDIQVQNEYNVFMGQCRAIIFGETLAKNGLNQALDFINRMPTFPPTAFVVIGRPTAEAIQYLKWPETDVHDQDIRWFFSNRPNQKFGVQKWSLFRDIYDPLQDPLVPLVTPLEDNSSMRVIGSAVFRGNRMVGELDLEETALLELMKDPQKENRITLSLGQNIHATFYAITGKNKIKVSYLNNQPHYQITMRLNGFLGELSGPRLPLTPKNLKQLKKQTESYLEESLLKIIKKLQTLESDPLGFGNRFRAKQPRHFSAHRWPLDYNQAEFKVKVKFFIDRIGVLK